MRRIDRIAPWALAALFAAPWLLGLAWDASFEAAPSNSALVSEGDDRIRELKVEIDNRGKGELCWGTTTITGCPASGDNGFSREGSARAFYTTAAPTTLTNGAATALGTGHDGRMRFDSDGVDNVDANLDDNSLFLYNGTAWEKFGLGALGTVDFVTAAPANGDLLKYDGTNWVPLKAAALSTFDRATFQLNEAFVDGACTACTVALVPDHAGGSDTNNYPEVTVPSVPSGMVWDIYVWGHTQYEWTTNDGTGPIGCRIVSDVNDADVFATAVTSVIGGDALSIATAGGGCQWYSVVRGVTAGSRYAFRLITQSLGGGTEDWDIEDTSAFTATYATGELVVEVRPRTVF